MSSLPRIAVTGASGYVGRFVTEHLQTAGYNIRALQRGEQAPAGFEQAPEWFRGDLAKASARQALCAQLLAGQHGLVHCALSHEPGRYRGGEGNRATQFWQTNLLATVDLLEAAIAQGVQRVVLLSSRAVFDGTPTNGHQPLYLGDDAAPLPNNHYGALKAAEEALARHYSENTALSVCCLRLTGVYGRSYPVERSKWLATIQAALVHNEAPPPRCATEVHGADVAAAVAIVLTAQAERVSGRVFNCSDLLIDHTDLISALQAHSNVPLPQPDAGAAPTRVLECNGLRQLGWMPGGEPRFKETVAQLANDVQTGETT